MTCKVHIYKLAGAEASVRIHKSKIRDSDVLLNWRRVCVTELKHPRLSSALGKICTLKFGPKWSEN